MPNVKSPSQLNEDYYDSVGRGKLYDEYKVNSVSSRRFEELQVSKDKTIIRLIDKTQRDIISFAAGKYVTFYGQNYFKIDFTWSKNHGKGYLTYIFEVIIYELSLVILSDGVHTSPGSKEFWIKQIRRRTFDIFRYDISSNLKRNAKNFIESEIWGFTELELIEIKKQKQKFAIFQGIDEEDIISENDFLNMNNSNEESITDVEILDEKNDLIFQSINFIEEFEHYLATYKEIKKSKHNIRLIAQRAT